MSRTGSIAVLASLFLAGTAHAHLGLTSPPSRYGSSVLKEGPCGMAGGTRSTNVSTFEPGQTIEVVWEEYINHPAHYRISFDDDGDDDFVDPATMMEFYSNSTVLMDNIPDRMTTPSDNEYRVTLTLPDVECDNCTLQVIQVMYDKPPYTVAGNDIYYQCADLVLRRSGSDAGPPLADAGTMPGTDAGPVVMRDSGTTPPRDAGSTPMRPMTDRGGCAVARGGPRDPSLALLFSGALALAIAARRRAGGAREASTRGGRLASSDTRRGPGPRRRW